MSLVTTARIKAPLRFRVLGAAAEKPIDALWRMAKRSLAIVLLCAAWEISPRLGLVDRVFLPPFSEVIEAAWRLLRSGALEENAAASLYRSFSGLALAIAIAVPTGLMLGWDRRIGEFLDPLLEIFRNTAALALLPVFTLILGIGETSKIAMVLYASTWPILLNTVSAVRTVDPLLVKAARSMGLNSVNLFIKVICPPRCRQFLSASASPPLTRSWY